MTIFPNIKHEQNIWDLFLPTVSAPDEQIPVQRTAGNIVEKTECAISRSQGYNDPAITTNEAHRCPSVLRNERLAPQRKIS
jgi:hypothetical protein